MVFTFGLALLILGTTGALAAFGGETWKRGEGPLAPRITPRCWLALAGMPATLGLGVAKEVKSTRDCAQTLNRQKALELKLTHATAELHDTRDTRRQSTKAFEKSGSISRGSDEAISFLARRLGRSGSMVILDYEKNRSRGDRVPQTLAIHWDQRRGPSRLLSEVHPQASCRCKRCDLYRKHGCGLSLADIKHILSA